MKKRKREKCEKNTKISQIKTQKNDRKKGTKKSFHNFNQNYYYYYIIIK